MKLRKNILNSCGIWLRKRTHIKKETKTISRKIFLEINKSINYDSFS